jgi:hypothetical protein
MQGVTLYDPQSHAADPAYLKGQDDWFRAGRIATIPQPQPGVWTLRLMGSGPYFVAIKAKTRIGLHNVKFGEALTALGSEQTLSLWFQTSSPNTQFQLVNAMGESLQPLPLKADPESAGHWTGSVVPGFKQFRVAVEGRDEQGYSFLRTDPRLFEAPQEAVASPL